MALRDLLVKIKAVFDKSTFDDAEKEVTTGFGRMEQMAKRVGKAIAAAFTATAIYNLGRVLLKAAADAEVPWNRLANTLGNVGIRFGDVERKLKLAARAMQDATTVDGEAFAGILDRLVALSGDFNRSLASVPLVADVAAKFFNGELAPAADLVGRALAGNVRGLRQLGITVKDPVAALRELASVSRGAAANELNTLQGRFEQIRNELNDLAEKGGAALLQFFARITGSESGDARETLRLYALGIAEIGDRLDRLNDPVRVKRQQLSDAVLAKNMKLAAQLQEELKELERAALHADERLREEGIRPTSPGPIGKTAEEIEEERKAAAKAAEEREKALDVEVQQLAQAYELGILRTDGVLRALDLEERYARALKAGNLSLAEQIRLKERIRTLEPVVTGGNDIGPMADPFARRPGQLSQIPGQTGPIRTPLSASTFAPTTQQFQATVEYMRQGWADIEDAGVNAALGVTGAFRDMFGVLLRDFTNLGEAAQTLGRGITGALLGGIAQFASKKVVENIALAFENYGKGKAAAASIFFAPMAPGFFSAALDNLKSAGLWSVLAGGAGAAQGAVGGGGSGGRSGGIPSGAADGIGRTLENQGAQVIIHNHFDPFNPRKPIHARTAATMVKAASRMDSTIDTRRRRRGS